MSELDRLQLKLTEYEELTDDLRKQIKELESKLNDIYYICREYT
jgi:chaperonin cofactor prefoldin